MIQSVGMMLEYSANSSELNKLIFRSINNVLENGYRTRDILNKKDKLISTSEMGDIIVNELDELKK